MRTLPQAQGPPQALIRAAAVWVRIAGLLAVLLGLKAAYWNALSGRQYEELLWAAASIAIASGAGAAMAVWRRREGWAFSAALGVNLAASLVVWYFRRDVDFDLWWLSLVQANVIASAAVAIVWLAARRRLYQLRELSLGDSPLLAVQTVLPVAGNLIVLIVPVVWLVRTPVYLPQWMAGLAEPAGWLALLLAAAAAAWYLHQTLPGHLPHVLGGLLLGAGVLCACHTVRLLDGWLAYQTLVTAWAAAGLILLGIGMCGKKPADIGDRPVGLLADAHPAMARADRHAGRRAGGDPRAGRPGRGMVVSAGDSCHGLDDGAAGHVAAAARVCLCLGAAVERRRDDRLDRLGIAHAGRVDARQRAGAGRGLGPLVAAEVRVSRRGASIRTLPGDRCRSPIWRPASPWG